MLLKPFHVQTIRRQLKYDLMGKDAFRGVTLSYSWLANQFGHFALGLIPTAIAYAIFRSLYKGGEVNIVAYLPTIVIWLAWFGFEVVNYRHSIIDKRNASAIQRRARIRFYNPRKWHFLDDWTTDLVFFLLGGVAACFLFMQNMVIVLACGGLLVVVFYKTLYWYPAKIYLQRALFPFQYRLSQWSEPMAEENVNAINRFMQSGFSGMQLLVLGEDDDANLRCCVGIGSEIAYQWNTCRYLTAMKAFECFYRKEPDDSDTAQEYCWNWQEAQLLVIDDINPSHPAISKVITPHEFLEKINGGNGERNCKLLREKKVIWMLGNENAAGDVQREWTTMLTRIGIDPTNIITINLDKRDASVNDSANETADADATD